MNIHDATILHCQRKLHNRIEFQGLKISVENRKGSVRKGTDADGKPWAIKMLHPYGYIRMTEGADGDHVDCYVGPNEKSTKVFVIHQNDPTTGDYDEDKCMLGFNSAKEAKRAYLAHYNRPGFFGSIHEMTMDEFKKKIFAKTGKIAAFGEPMSADSPFHGHLDIIPTSLNPAYKQGKSMIPADNPGEKNNRFLDVTKRNEKGTMQERLKKMAKTNKPVPVGRTAIQHHTGDATPFPTQVGPAR